MFCRTQDPIIAAFATIDKGEVPQLCNYFVVQVSVSTNCYPQRHEKAHAAPNDVFRPILENPTQKSSVAITVCGERQQRKQKCSPPNKSVRVTAIEAAFIQDHGAVEIRSNAECPADGSKVE